MFVIFNSHNSNFNIKNPDFYALLNYIARNKEGCVEN
jgi:hypothetical protein